MKKVCLIAAFASILLAGCSNDESPSGAKTETAKNELGIVVDAIGTRAIKSGFIAADEVSVFVTGTGYTPALVNYKYSGTAWAPSGGAGTGIKLVGNAASVYAFYPKTLTLSALSAAGTFPVTLLAADDFSATATPDYLWGTGTTVSNLTPGTTNTSTLTLKHALAKISFVINADANYPITGGSGALTKIELLSAGTKLVTAGTVAVGTGAFAATASIGAAFTYTGTKTINAAAGTTITASALEAPIKYTATDFVLKLTIDGKAMVVTGFPAAPDWSDASKNYVYTITVSPTELVLASTVVINDWTATAIPGLTAN